MTRSRILHQAQKTGDYSLSSKTVKPERGKGRKRRPRVKRIETADELVDALQEQDPKAFLVLDEAGMRIEWETEE